MTVTSQAQQGGSASGASAASLMPVLVELETAGTTAGTECRDVLAPQPATAGSDEPDAVVGVGTDQGPSRPRAAAEFVVARVRLAGEVVVGTGHGLLVGVIGLVVPLVVVFSVLVGFLPSFGSDRRARRRAAKRRRARMSTRAARFVDRAAQIEVRRLRAATGLAIPDPPDRDPASQGRLDAQSWQRTTYWLVRLPMSLAQTWVLSMLVLLPLVVAVGSLSAFLPDPTTSIRTVFFGYSTIGPRRALAAGSAGLVIGTTALMLLPGWSRTVDAELARGLLAHTDPDELVERVHELSVTREQALDSAESERRRIERDLHDGAQQRLVALSMLLGRAQARTADDDALAALLREARTETAAAIGEIRDLTRGLHPPVLTDRGLDAALSAVAARAGLPVDVQVDLPRRPSPTLEAVVYFAVCEALTNVSKHARAGRAWVRIDEIEMPTGPALLRAVVVDDGIGGADPRAGRGLAGLRDRLAGVDGRLEVNSPPGGPTEVVVQIPMGRS